jgi:antirestriction protein ArdC
MASQKIERIHEDLQRGVAQLSTEEDWRRALDVASRFHRYSWHNIMLILLQRDDATQVAGYRKWQEMGRQVRRGERGISILAPRFRVEEDEETSQKVRRLAGFIGVSVFDVSQTDGDPLPSVESFVHRLDGDAPQLLWDRLAEQVAAAGFTLERGEPSVHGANGVTDFLSRTVTVAPWFSQAQATKTLAHELAHVQMHEQGEGSRARREVEAESVAYIVCRALGLETADYSFGYVAGWSGGDVKVVQETGTRVMAVASQILDALAIEPEAVAA